MKRCLGVLLASCALLALAPQSRAGTAVNEFRLSGVSLKESTYLSQAALEMRMPSSAYQDPAKEQLTDRTFMAWLPMDFRNGTIDVDVASELAPDAPSYARGFVGITFRIDDSPRFEGIYLRPTNSVAEEQIFRNHSVQYFSYPDYPWYRLRKEAPEKYESYTDIAPGRWIHMKIAVAGNSAKLYLDNKALPALVVNDLKLGADQRGGVGVWIETGTIAHFRDLRVTQAP